ncbi:M28 family peptidase [Geobacter pickeringii]|uniref:Peptidase M28 n=1 Tax=Geobacter pickeringii TaxID=345632 RepID=A0A0B5B9K4_9BACT|nr:M28 family peptidase [Geobacter pickeringii]AJE03262.1 peptidase M28 [Geobacter pickeringii]
MSECVEKCLRAVSVDRIRSHIKALEGVRHPVAAPEALERAAGYIRGVFGSLGYPVADHPFTDRGREFANIIATHPGSSPPGRRVLAVAHFDTVSTTPGADDNASGVAVLLELATILKSLGFEHALQFAAVNLEENEHEGDPQDLGTRGSRALAAQARREGWEVEGAVVLESVAYAGDRIVQRVPAGIPVAVPTTGNFIAVIGNEASREMVLRFERAVRRCEDGLPWAPLVVPGNGELIPDSRRSDHAPFWDHGYRAIMLTDTTNFRNPHYHQPGDTLETLNLGFAAQVCRATAALLLDLAGVCGPS